MEKYNRLKLIFNDMNYDLRRKFIEKNNIRPCTLDEEWNIEFEESMKQFLADFARNPGIQRSCECFPELKNVPHPDRIPEVWGLNAHGREILKNAYIERMELENFDLIKENNELRKKIAELAEETIELKNKYNDLRKDASELKDRTIEPASKTVHPEENTDLVENTVAEEIYNKLFFSPVSRYRYLSLNKDDICWIHDHVNFSETYRVLFDTCCVSSSLSEVSEKTGMSLSAVKRGSSAITDSIRFALVQACPGLIEKVVKNG